MGRNTLAIACAIIGGFLGYLGFVMLIDRGFYALVLPGGILGLSAGIVRTRTTAVAALSALLAVAAGLMAERRYAPFVVDTSLGYFCRHVTDLHR